MNFRILAAAAAAACLAAVVSASHAAEIVYSGDLSTSAAAPSTGTVGGFGWFLDDGARVNFWRVFATAGEQITLIGNRLSPNLDLALSVYQGTTTADASAFRSDASWGGMTYLLSLDDEAAPAVGGAFGDPYGVFTATVTGYYTVAIGGGSGSTDAGFYAYNLQAVPEPSAAVLLALGLGGVLAARRRAARKAA